MFTFLVQYKKSQPGDGSCTGVLIDFISVPVTVGFTSATSVIIATSQLKGLLGLKFESSGFLDTVRQVCLHLPEARVADSLLGLICITVLLLLRVTRLTTATL